MNKENQTSNKPGKKSLACMNRREFLLNGGSVVAVVTLASLPGFSLAESSQQNVKLSRYPVRKIGRISQLKTGEPLLLQYPYPDTQCNLVKLGTLAGAGVGPEKDIVCFTTICTHMGGPLHGTYKPEHQVLGACPLHLSTFDLTRHGMVVSGHATESLPQVLLETENDDILATGVMGLIYGYSANLANGNRD